MGLILVYPSSTGGGGGGTGSDHSHSNLSILNKLSTDSKGNLRYSGKIIGESAIETSYSVTLAKGQKTIELPEDCDISRAITLSFDGITLQQDAFWEVIEKDSPEKDLISWVGLGLESLAQEGDKILITYYKKV